MALESPALKVIIVAAFTAPSFVPAVNSSC